jgi:hypothetical protein
VPGHAAVGVDDDLAAGQAGVAHRSAEDELAGRVDQQPHVGGVEGRQVDSARHRAEHLLADVGVEQAVDVDVGGVLAGDDDGVQPHRLVAVVLDGDLRLAVRAQVREHARLADLGQPPGQPVGQRDRQRHQLGRLVGGVAEHQALVAGALPGDLVVGEPSTRASYAVSTPCAMSGDCAPMATLTPHDAPSKPLAEES